MMGANSLAAPFGSGDPMDGSMVMVVALRGFMSADSEQPTSAMQRLDA